MGTRPQDLELLLTLVTDMRRKQKDFFNTHRPSDLHTAKDAEVLVDAILTRLNSRQPTLL